MPKPPPAPDDELPELDDLTDAQELEQDFDPGAPEPIGELPETDDGLGSDLDIQLSSTEPEGTRLTSALPRPDELLLAPLDDLEDFSTQETIPILPWSLEAELLEIGHTLPAVLEPTAAETTWEHPESGDDQRLTVRLRMVVAATVLRRVVAPQERLRVGRDILAGRALILVE